MSFRSLFYSLHNDTIRHIVSFCPNTLESVENHRNALFDEKKDALSVSAIIDFGGIECVDVTYLKLNESLHLVGPRTRVIRLQHGMGVSLLLEKKIRLHIAQMCPNLEVFNDDYGMFSDEELIGIVRSCPLLSKIFICAIAAKMTDASLIEMGNNSKNLASLTLIVEDDSKVSDVGLTAVLQGCPKIEKLTLWDYGNHFVDESYREISRLSSLQKLNLSATIISDETLIQIANGCKNLKELTTTRSDALSNEAFIEVGRLCPEITVLELSWGISASAIIHAFPNLMKISCYGGVFEEGEYNEEASMRMMNNLRDSYPNVEFDFFGVYFDDE